MRSESSKHLQPVVSLAEIRCQRVDRNRGTLQESWDLYLASQALEQLKPSSRPVYTQAARLALSALPARPTPSDVRLWLEALVRDGLSPATANKFLRALKSITERATYVSQATDLRIRNAFKANRPFRMPARERRDASAATVRRLLELAQGPIERLAVRLAAFYGLRKGELLGLQPADVRMDGGILRVRIVRTRDVFGERDRKNALNGKKHVLSITKDIETEELITKLLQYAERTKHCARGQHELCESWLIPWGHDYPDALMRRWKKDPEVELGAGDAWHALRHFGATALAAAGKPMAEIQAWLGDSTGTATLCYQGQVRGTTVGTASVVLESFARSEGALVDAGATHGAGKSQNAAPAGEAPSQSESKTARTEDERSRFGFNPILPRKTVPSYFEGETHE